MAMEPAMVSAWLWQPVAGGARPVAALAWLGMPKVPARLTAEMA